jgi:nucleoid DNA-binding protein
MKKSNLIDEIYKTTDFTKKDITLVVDTMFDIIKKCLQDGEAVSISKFGSFVLTDRRAKELYIPGTTNKVYVKAKRAVKFKPSIKLKDAVERTLESA